MSNYIKITIDKSVENEYFYHTVEQDHNVDQNTYQLEEELASDIIATARLDKQEATLLCMQIMPDKGGYWRITPDEWAE